MLGADSMMAEGKGSIKRESEEARIPDFFDRYDSATPIRATSRLKAPMSPPQFRTVRPLSKFGLDFSTLVELALKFRMKLRDIH